MICKVCGCDNPEGSGVCLRCGAPLSAAPPPGGPYVPEAVRVLKESGSSALFLVSAILLTCSLVFQLLGSIWSVDLADRILSDLSGASSAYSYGYLSGLSIGTLLGLIPGGLMVIGFWLFYAACRRPGERISTAGLSIIKGVTIFYQVLLWIVTVLVGVYVVLLLTVGSFLLGKIGDWGSTGDVVAVASGLIFLVLAIAAAYLILLIVFNFKTLRAIRALKYTAVSGMPSADIPGFFIGFCFVIGGISALSLLLLDIAGACSAAFYILLGIQMSRYKRRMQALMPPAGGPFFPAPDGTPDQAPYAGGPQGSVSGGRFYGPGPVQGPPAGAPGRDPYGWKDGSQAPVQPGRPDTYHGQEPGRDAYGRAAIPPAGFTGQQSSAPYEGGNGRPPAPSQQPAARCPGCGRPFGPGESFCAQCGHKR